MDSKLKLSKEKRDEMIKLIKSFFENERDEEIGDLSAMLVLDFFIKELAPDFYNQGVNDSHKCISDKLEDLYALQIIKR